jgi:transposase
MTTRTKTNARPRKRAAITDTAINAAVRKATETKQYIRLKDPEQTGLELRVWPGGNRTWTLQCRDAIGRPRRYNLGQHSAQFGLAAAREACRTLREKVRDGADPTADAKARREAVRDAKEGRNTLQALVNIYARQEGGRLKSWAEYKRRIEVVFAKQLNQPLTELTLQTLQQAADRWQSPLSAAAACRYLRPILKWAAHPAYAQWQRS